jgi:hypothetical protein
LRGNTRFEGKLMSLFEPSTEVIRAGKAGKPNEFGKMIKLQEAENQIVIDYEVYARRTGCEGTHQRRQAQTRPQALPLQGRDRHAALGRARHHRRQPHQPRPGHARASLLVALPINAPRTSLPTARRACCCVGAIDRSSQSPDLCAGK